MPVWAEGDSGVRARASDHVMMVGLEALVGVLGANRGAGHSSRRPTWGFSLLPQPECFPRRVSVWRPAQP